MADLSESILVAGGGGFIGGLRSSPIVGKFQD
jgi:hypothetical protein